MLNYSNCTSLTKIEGLESLLCDNCPWISQKNPDFKNNIQNLITLQEWFKKNILIMKIERMATNIIPIWWDPTCKGGFFHKKSLLEYVDRL
jgi:hypothetical protein